MIDKGSHHNWRVVLLVCSLCVSAILLADTSVTLQQLRIAENARVTRLVFDLSGPVRHTIFTLSDPERVVIDLQAVSLQTDVPREFNHLQLLQGIRSASRNGNDLRIVLDLKQRSRPKSFPLKPEGPYGHRLVVDLYDGHLKEQQRVVKTVPAGADKLRDIVIAIDAGHGGKDPGALGSRGTREKDITLQIAKRLAEAIQRQSGMRAVLVREGDEYIDLRERMYKARKHKADMFVSIHADAFHRKDAGGSSVYALSLNGATSEAAKWLADKENAADLIGGVSLGDKDELVASVLLDLSQTATIQSSLEAGRLVLRQLGKVNRIHKEEVQQAGFIVLKSPDIPSILIETAFLTNPSEERNLRSHGHQAKMVEAIVVGLKDYFTHKAPPGTLLADMHRRVPESGAHSHLTAASP